MQLRAALELVCCFWDVFAAFVRAMCQPRDLDAGGAKAEAGFPGPFLEPWESSITPLPTALRSTREIALSRSAGDRLAIRRVGTIRVRCGIGWSPPRLLNLNIAPSLGSCPGSVGLRGVSER